jgi:hypothetical protein
MKPLYVAIVALTLPVALAAQQPAAASAPANPITTVFRTRTLAQQRNLALASIPESNHRRNRIAV